MSKRGTHHCARSRVPDEVKLAVDITELVAGLPCWSEKGNDDTVRVLELESDALRVSLRVMRKREVETHKDVGVVGARPPAVGSTIWTVKDAAALR